MQIIHLHGRLTGEPEIMKTSTGNEYGRFNLAVNNRRRRENEPEAVFYQITVWDPRDIERCRKYLHKGYEVILGGELMLKPYIDNNGNAQVYRNVTLNFMEFCGGGSRNDAKAEANTSATPAPAAQPAPAPAPVPQKPVPESAFTEVTDDDLPF